MDNQEQSNNYKNLVIVLMSVIIFALIMLHYTDYIGDKQREQEQFLQDIYNNVSPTNNDNKSFYNSNFNDTIMIDENETLADNKTLLNQS